MRLYVPLWSTLGSETTQTPKFPRATCRERLRRGAAPGLESRAGKRRCEQPVLREALHGAEPLGSTFEPAFVPGLPLLDDLLMAAADEVPPHHDLLLERLAAEHDRDA